MLAKTAAAAARRKQKDWYDIAFLLLHNDDGGPEEAADVVTAAFKDELGGTIRTSLLDLRANFAAEDAQGPRAYRTQMQVDHPSLDPVQLTADAILAVEAFCARLVPKPR